MAVHDPLFEQRIVDAHDDTAGDLRFPAELIDDQAAVLDRDEVGAADDAGFGIDFDFRDLDAADALVGEPAAPFVAQFGVLVHLCIRRPIAGRLDRVHAEARAGLPPRNALVVISAIDDHAGLDRQVAGLGV